MSYNKDTRRPVARASAVALPPPPPLTDLAEWPYLESSAARARNASATAIGGNSRAQQRLGGVNGESLPEQAAAEHEAHGDNSAVTQQGTNDNPPAPRGSSLPEQVGLEHEAQVGTATQRGSAMLAHEVPPEAQQPGESFQEYVDRQRRFTFSMPVTWEDGGPSSLASPNGDGPPPNNGARATRPADQATTWDAAADNAAPFPAEWWIALPEGLSPEEAKAVWLEKGKPNCTACARAHPPPHSNLVAQQGKQQRRQQKLEYRAKQAAAAPEKNEPAGPSTTRAQSSAAGKRQNSRCQRCGNYHSGPCRAPLCASCGQCHFQKKGTACTRRGWVYEMPPIEQQRRNAAMAILGSKTKEQAQFWTELFEGHVPGLELELARQQGQQQDKQQQQQQSRPPPRQNQRGRSSQRPRGRSASPRREVESGGGGSYRERSPNTRRNGNKGGGRGPSRRPPKNG